MNGCGNGHQGNGVANFYTPNGGRPHGDSDDEDFQPAEVTRTGSSNEDFFDAAEDGLEEYLSSDEDFHNVPSVTINGSSRAAPAATATATRGRRTSYRDLVARIQEESRRRAEAEEALSACTKRLNGVQAAVAAAQKALDEAALVSLPPAGTGDAQGGNDSRTADINEAGNEDAGSRSADGSQDGPTEADASESISAETDVAGIVSVDADATGTVDVEADASGSADVEAALAKAVAAAMKRGEEHLVSDKEQADLVARKEAEVSRLRDKLQYWERMNQEMAQKNNEAIEHMRAHRRRWNVIWKALGVGAAVTLNEEPRGRNFRGKLPGCGMHA
ncbi:unnamed protein product [Closterium sp. Naga37s-1]|nr:unnamed protein product [Closterium sp. Naga37s-1]